MGGSNSSPCEERSGNACAPAQKFSLLTCCSDVNENGESSQFQAPVAQRSAIDDKKARYHDEANMFELPLHQEDAFAAESVENLSKDEYPLQTLNLRPRPVRPVEASRSPRATAYGQKKTTMKQRMKDKLQAFKADIAEGIELGLLLIDAWCYVPAKVTCVENLATKNICIEAALEVHKFTMFQVQGVYSFWDAVPLSDSVSKCVSPLDRDRAIILFYQVADDPRKNTRMCCLLEFDKEAREMFVSAMTIWMEAGAPWSSFHIPCHQASSFSSSLNSGATP